MTDIILSDDQASAVRQIVHWYRQETGRKQIFRLFGYAGTGKSTLLRYALAELGLCYHTPEQPGVVTATFTGKAALVLRRMGVPARTIHSLIYRMVEPTEEEFQRIEDAITVATSRAAELDGEDRVLAEASIIAMRRQLMELTAPQFVLDYFGSDAADCKLIVLDEVSMVGADMAADVLSFRKPVLVIGDPGQLPPIRSEGFFIEADPDVMLTGIHRQAAESPIIRLATRAREGSPIAYGRYGELVAKVRKSKARPEALLRADQVICGYNATRLDLNNRMKHEAGFNGDVLPAGKGEKIICLKNQNDVGLINGMFLRLEDVHQDTEFSFSARAYDEYGVPIGEALSSGKARRRYVYSGHFDDHAEFDPDRIKRDWRHRKGLVEAVWGYAITVHKAQGSGWGKVLVYDDGFGRNELDRCRWLYTAITRAESGLVIAA